MFVSILLKTLVWENDDLTKRKAFEISWILSSLCVLITLPQQTTCDTDYLEIRDGDSMTSPLIARYCGEVRYTELISSGPLVLIHFVSDGVIDESKRGFQLQHIGK